MSGRFRKPLQDVVQNAETRSMMLFFMALLVWSALSIPAAVILGRIIAAAGDREVPSPARRAATSGHVSGS